MYGALVMFEDEFIHIVAISFSALVLTELIMVALTIRTWHHIMIIAELISLALYLLSLVVLKDYFGKKTSILVIIEFATLKYNDSEEKGLLGALFGIGSRKPFECYFHFSTAKKNVANFNMTSFWLKMFAKLFCRILFFRR